MTETWINFFLTMMVGLEPGPPEKQAVMETTIPCHPLVLNFLFGQDTSKTEQFMMEVRKICVLGFGNGRPIQLKYVFEGHLVIMSHE